MSKNLQYILTKKLERNSINEIELSVFKANDFCFNPWLPLTYTILHTISIRVSIHIWNLESHVWK
jgi:hypothetical protein